jgi:flagellar biosynthesis GTPase FlhF
MICIAALALLFVPAASFAQPAAPDDSAPANAAAPDQPDKPPLTAPELEQLVAPVALYPDSLLTQMLMASTYPLEIVEADRWVKANPNLKGDELAAELDKQDWDPSVKSLVNFPDVLSMMSQKLDVTIKLGDAFLGQRQDVMNAVQVLRNKAQAAGNLKSSDQEKVDVAAATPADQPVDTGEISADQALPPPPVVQAPPQVITIESPNPQIIYVPTYNPADIYGSWPYADYPPVVYYVPPPGYIWHRGLFFGVGITCGLPWGYAWGHSDWHRHSIDIDIHRNVTFNNHIDRARYQKDFVRANPRFSGDRGVWRHDPVHRGGVAYPDRRTQLRFSAENSARRTAREREQFRGREETIRAETARDLAHAEPGHAEAGRAQAAHAEAERAQAAHAEANRAQVNHAEAERAQTAHAQEQAHAQQQAHAEQERAHVEAEHRAAAPAPAPVQRAPSGGGPAFGGMDRGANVHADSQRGAVSRQRIVSHPPPPPPQQQRRR